MPFNHALSSVADLRSVYRHPSKPSVAKEIHHLDQHCRDFIGRSPFALMASASASGSVDVSPRGGHAGFVKVLDEHRLAIPDLAGNNRLDSMTNLVESPGVGLLFLIPGLDETLRVNGVATITTDPSILEVCTDEGLAPNVAIGVDVAQAYIHCAKAFRRSRLWRSDDWQDLSDMTTTACILRDHYQLPEMDLATVESRLADLYENTTWEVGGNR